MDKAEIIFKSKGQTVTVNVSYSKDGKMKINIDFGDKGAANQEGFHILLLNLFTNALLGESDESLPLPPTSKTDK